MLEWSADLEHHTEIRCWSVEKGYKIDFPRKSKTIFKILKQLYIKHKVEERRIKGTMSKFAETIIDSGKGGESVVDYILQQNTNLKNKLKQARKIIIMGNKQSTYNSFESENEYCKLCDKFLEETKDLENDN